MRQVRPALAVLTLASIVACAPHLPDDLPGLIQAMGSNDMRLNFAAAHRVEKLFGIDGLLVAIESEDPATRAVAAHSLMRHSGHRAQAALLKASYDGDEYVRMWSAFSLGRIGDSSILPRLQELEQDPSPLVARRAEEATKNLTQRLSERPSSTRTR